MTLFGVAQPHSSSETIVTVGSASIDIAGVAQSGQTTFVEVDTVTSLLFVESFKTVTAISVPTTYTRSSSALRRSDPYVHSQHIQLPETSVADASGFHATILFVGTGGGTVDEVETCGFGEDGRGTCVVKLPGQMGASFQSLRLPRLCPQGYTATRQCAIPSRPGRCYSSPPGIISQAP